MVFYGSVCLLLSVLTGHQHAKSIQEFHYPGPAGGVQKLHPEPCDGGVPALRQTPPSQHPHAIQVSVRSSEDMHIRSFSDHIHLKVKLFYVHIFVGPLAFLIAYSIYNCYIS